MDTFFIGDKGAFISEMRDFASDLTLRPDGLRMTLTTKKHLESLSRERLD
jgi:hypothetical protein